MDSQLVIRHLNGVYRLKAANLKPYFDKVKALESRYESVQYFHHDRSSETAIAADLIANNYLQQSVSQKKR